MFFRSCALLAVLLLSAHPIALSQTKIPDAKCRIRHISDGDSFICTDGRRVRLLMIDAPELSQAPYGRQARNYLMRIMPESSVVTLTFDVRKRDRNGRLLAFAQRGNLDINRQMLRSGMAVVLVYPPNVARVDALRAAADSARREQLGLWARNAFECLPVNYRAKRCR